MLLEGLPPGLLWLTDALALVLVVDAARRAAWEAPAREHGLWALATAVILLARQITVTLSIIWAEIYELLLSNGNFRLASDERLQDGRHAGKAQTRRRTHESTGAPCHGAMVARSFGYACGAFAARGRAQCFGALPPLLLLAVQRP